MLKGISPLVAVVLLVAVVMSIAGILAFWATQFTRQRIEQFERETQEAECQFADFDVFKCSYDSNTSKITLILQNIRRVDLENLTAFVIYQNDSIIPEEGYSLGKLEANRIKTFNLENVSSDYREILITTHCPEVNRRITC